MTTFATKADAGVSTEYLLRALVARGFQFLDPRDDTGEIVAVVGVRAHHDVIDVIQLFDEDDAVGSRIPSNEDVLAPRRVLWQQRGTARDVLAVLLDLPDDRLPGTLIVPRSA
jgi:hypothetical protein